MSDGMNRQPDSSHQLTDTVEVTHVIDVSEMDIERKVFVEEIAREVESVVHRVPNLHGTKVNDEIEEAVREYDGDYTELKEQSRTEALKLLAQSVYAMRHEELSE